MTKKKYEYAAAIFDNRQNAVWQGYIVAYNVSQAKTLLRRKFKSKIKRGYQVEIAIALGKSDTNKKIGITRELPSPY